MHDAAAPTPRFDGTPDEASQAHPIRFAPLALWRVAHAFLLTLHALFGAPEDVAREHTITTRSHALLASWLRCAEAMLRRLVLIEASAYPKPNTRPLLREARQRVRAPVSFFAEQPEAWRVSFRCFASATLRHAQRDAENDPARLGSVSLSLSKATRRRFSRKDPWWYETIKPVRFRSAWPLAERYEALIRVFNNPAPYARRLAASLQATPHRLREALRAPPEAMRRVDDFEAMGERAEIAWRPRFSSA